MARSTSENQDAYGGSGKIHPVDTGDLLALVRDQPVENEAFVRQHLATCARCQQSHRKLIQTSKMLESIEQTTKSQRYPELSTAYLMRNARLGYSQQRFSGRRAARYAYDGTQSPLRLVPVAMILILFTIAVIALALVSYSKIPRQLNGPGTNLHLGTNAVGSTVVVAQMPKPGDAGTPGASSQPGMGTLAGSLSDCSTPADKARHILDICGSNFNAGDKILLIVVNNSGQGEPFNAGKVDASGAFTAHLNISSCKDGPLSIYAKDTTDKPPLDSSILPDIAVPGCGRLTPKTGGR